MTVAALELREGGPVTSKTGQNLANLEKNSQLVQMDLDAIYVSKDENVRGIGSDAYSDESIGEMMAQIESIGGLLYPLTVAQVKPGPETDNKSYILIAGYRRALALKQLDEDQPDRGWSKGIVCKIVKDGGESEGATALVQMLENMARRPLTPMEIAIGCTKALADKDSDLNQKDVARILGRSEANISQYLKLMRFPKPVQDLLSSGKLQFSHAREILNQVPESAWANVATKATGMTIDDFNNYLKKEYGGSGDEETTDADGNRVPSQKAPKMLRATDVNNKYVPFLKTAVEKSDATNKVYTAKDLAAARLDTLNTVLLNNDTALSKDIAPYLEELTKQEAQQEAEAESKKNEDKFWREQVKRVKEIANPPIDPANPDAQRPTLTQAYSQAGQEVVALSEEKRKAAGFVIPTDPNEIVQKIAGTYQLVIKEAAESKAKREEAKAKKLAEEEAKKAGTTANGEAGAGAGTGAAAPAQA